MTTATTEPKARHTQATRELLTHSRMTCFKRCRKEHWFRYELGLRPDSDSYALTYGTFMHDAIRLAHDNGLEAAIYYIQSNAPDAFGDPYAPHTLMAQLRAYWTHWRGKPTTGPSLVREMPFQKELRHPKDNRRHPHFDLAGKIDGVSEKLNGTASVMDEIKTMGEDPTSDRYWRRLLIDPQLSLYFPVAREMYPGTQEIMYDVIRKPSMEPHKATPVEKRQYTKKDHRLYANQREYDETPEEWEKRLYEDMLDRPDFYLARKPLQRLEHDLDEFAYEVWDIATAMADAKRNSRWYRTPGRATCDICSFWNLCVGLTPFEPGDVPEGFKRLDNVHPELGE